MGAQGQSVYGGRNVSTLWHKKKKIPSDRIPLTIFPQLENNNIFKRLVYGKTTAYQRIQICIYLLNNYTGRSLSNTYDVIEDNYTKTNNNSADFTKYNKHRTN